MAITKTVSNRETEMFIQSLYCEASNIAPGDFRNWALLQLTELLNVDAAIWGTGNLNTLKFHYLEHLGLDADYGKKLIETLHLNPIRESILNNLDNPISMSEVIEDPKFFKSSLYKQLFAPYGIQRILATGHIEQHSKLHSLISLYRFDRDKDFLEKEKTIISRLIYHLVSAASHNFFLHIEARSDEAAMAICDKHGCYWHVQPKFVDLLSETPVVFKDVFPLEQNYELNEDLNGIKISIAPLGELLQITVRKVHPLDQLSAREQQIVHWIIQGLTFKEVARELGIAPSTISNHLYRIYRKLEITSRSELARLFQNR